MEKRRQKPLSAERRIILVFVLSTIASIVLVGAGLSYSLQHTALARNRAHLESLANILARQCENEIAEARLELEFMAKTPVFRKSPCSGRIDTLINGIPGNVDVEKRQFLTGLMNIMERFSVIYVLRPNGDIYLVEPFKIQPKLTTRNLSERPYFREAVRTKAPVVSEGYRGADGVLAVAILIPILGDSNHVKGYLGGVFYLCRLSRLVSAEKIKPFDAGFIVDQQGRLIAHTDTTLLREGIRDHFTERHWLPAKFITSAVSTAGAMQPVAQLGECMDATHANSHLTTLVPLSSGWTLGLSRDKAAVVAEVRPVTWGITALAGLLLALIGGFGITIAHGVGKRWDNAERALRASENRFRIAAETANDLVYEWDLKQSVQWFGKIDEILGYAPNEFSRTLDGWAAAVHPEDRERVMTEVKEHLERCVPYASEYRVRMKDGVYRWWTARGEAERTSDGKPFRWIGTVTDITERKLTQESLKESEEKFRNVFDNSAIGKSITSLDGSVNVNPAFYDMLGYSKEEFAHQKWQNISHQDDYELTQQNLQLLKSGKKNSARFVKRYYKKNGSILWADVNTVLQKDTEGKPLYYITAVIDITERKLAEESLKRVLADLSRSNKELEQFAYVASHDLQEPLRMVSSYTQLLAQKYEARLDDKAKKYINYAVDGAIRMQRLINDLLTYSRISTKGKPSEPIDSHSVLGEALRNLAVTIEENHAVITNDDLPMVSADDSQLMLVFQNIIANAIKFRQEEIPRIHISIKEQGGDWVFSVKDNGIGIDSKYSERLFIIFQRLHTKEEYPGTGIGLAVCKRIVERHGGRIWFESELGKGTTFFFTIPKQERMVV
jgi:PAS domain S-box-containing protein